MTARMSGQGGQQSVCCVMLESVSVQSLADHWQLFISYTVTCHQGQPHAADISHSHVMVTGAISHQGLVISSDGTSDSPYTEQKIAISEGREVETSLIHNPLNSASRCDSLAPLPL